MPRAEAGKGSAKTIRPATIPPRFIATPVIASTESASPRCREDGEAEKGQPEARGATASQGLASRASGPWAREIPESALTAVSETANKRPALPPSQIPCSWLLEGRSRGEKSRQPPSANRVLSKAISAAGENREWGPWTAGSLTASRARARARAQRPAHRLAPTPTPNHRWPKAASITIPLARATWTRERGARLSAATWSPQAQKARAKPAAHQGWRIRATAVRSGRRAQTGGASRAPLNLSSPERLERAAQASAQKAPRRTSAAIADWGSAKQIGPRLAEAKRGPKSWTDCRLLLLPFVCQLAVLRRRGKQLLLLAKADPFQIGKVLVELLPVAGEALPGGQLKFGGKLLPVEQLLRFLRLGERLRRFDLDPAVALQAGCRRDQLADDHVLLEAVEAIDLPFQIGVGEHL